MLGVDRAASAMVAASGASVLAWPGCRLAIRRIARPGRYLSRSIVLEGIMHSHGAGEPCLRPRAHRCGLPSERLLCNPWCETHLPVNS